jgi:nucleoside-diphosphate-sugar epimerase
LLKNKRRSLALIGNNGELGKFLQKKLSSNYQIHGNNKFKILSRKSAKIFARTLPLCRSIIVCAGNTRYRCTDKNDFTSHLKIVQWMDEIIKRSHPIQILYISSTSVYGENLKHIFTDEKTIPKPYTLYSKTKLKAEKIISSICKESKVPLCIIRLPIIVGKKTNASFPTPQNLMNQVKQKKQTYIIPGSLYPRRPYLTIEEFAEIVEKIVKQRVSGIFNLVPDASISLIDLCCRRKVPQKIVINFSGHHLPLDQSFSNEKIKKAININSIKGIM